MLALAAEVIAIGWGRSEMPITTKLREAPLHLVPFEECRANNKSTHSKYQLCTRGVNGTQAVPGDSGGPIVQLREKGNPHSGYVQVGIANWRENNQGDYYVYWADVAAYAGWIHRRISGCGNHRFSHILTNVTIPTKIIGGSFKNSEGLVITSS